MAGQQEPSDFLKHPSYHQVATFFLGFVFISCVHFTFHVPLAAVRRLRLYILGHRATSTRRGSGVEANSPPDDDKVHRWLGGSRSNPATSTSGPFRPKTNNLALTLTLCLAMASLANFGSLLAFDRASGLGACAFLVAWGGMAAQSARLLGLLKLSLDLRRLGVPRWETFLYRGSLLLAVAAMFASNAISIGVLSPLPNSRLALCNRKHFLPMSVVSSAINIILEVYSVIRINYLIVPDFLSPRHKFDALLDVRMSRALSLLILDLLTAIPTAHFFNVLADFIPGSLGSLIVLAAFNQKSPDVRLASTASIPGTHADSLHSRSTIEIKKMPSSRSLTDHRQRISHPFAASALLDQSPETEDWPESASPRDPEKAYIPDLVASTLRPPKRQTWRNSDQSMNSETDSEVARSVKGAIVGFAFKDVVGSSPRQRERSFLPRMPQNLPTARAEIFPLSTPFRVPRPILPPQPLQVETLERASRYERDIPSSVAPSPASFTPPRISITLPTPGFIASGGTSMSTTTGSSRPSISVSLASNVGSKGSSDSAKSSLHLTPSTPAQSQPSRRASSESDWRYDSRHDSLGSHPSSGEEAPSLQLQQRNSGGSARMPPADDDLSIVYEASHEGSDSVPPSRAYRPTFGEHMFVEGGIGRPISTPVGMPEDVQEGGHSNGSQ